MILFDYIGICDVNQIISLKWFAVMSDSFMFESVILHAIEETIIQHGNIVNIFEAVRNLSKSYHSHISMYVVLDCAIIFCSII